MAIEINIDASAYVKKTELLSNLTLYPTNVASDIPAYLKMVTNAEDADYNVMEVGITTPPINGTGIEIARLATTAGVLLGNPGIINLTTLGNVRRVSGTSSATFNYEMYHRDSLDVETLIATSSMTANVDVNIYEQFSASAVLNNGDWIATDRIVIVYYGTKVGGGSNSVFEFQFGGTNPVRTIVPVPASDLLTDYELISNKQNDLTTDGTGTKFPTVDAMNEYADQIVIALNGKANATALTNHTSNTSNPHGVTKSQVGLSNVDNTSDANKPISTATQTALNTKLSTVTIDSTTITSGTDGRILFQKAGKFGQSSGLFWNDTTIRLGINQAVPTSKLHVKASDATSSAVFRVENSAGSGDLFNVQGDGIVKVTRINNSIALGDGSSSDTYITYSDRGFIGFESATGLRIQTGTARPIVFALGAWSAGEVARFNQTSGNFGLKNTNPTARLHIGAGTATANTAPLKFDTGVLMTTPENGAFEFNGTNLYFTVGGVRKIVTLL